MGDVETITDGNFKLMDLHELGNLEKITNIKRKGCLPEVDLKYPTELYDLHNDLPLVPKRLDLGKLKKLAPNLKDKKNVIHHKALKSI